MEDLRIIVTGGTIDKVHDVAGECLAFSPDGTTHIPDILRVGRCHFPSVEVVLMQDSLDFEDDDRNAIANAVINAPERFIVITHGTGTLGNTARFLVGKAPEKTVVLTGAMRPYTLSSSDGNFNLGGAVIAAQTVGAGVWGVMNGRVFAADHLTKNTELGRFDA